MAADTTGTWVVTGQKEDFQTDSNGRPTNGVLVYFRTAQGHNGSVFVPLAEYNAGRVQQLIRQKAAVMDQVGNLTGA